MSEEMARALGASGALTVTIGGKECTVRPLGIQELTELERDCLTRYKRQYLETFAKNMDLLPRDQRGTLLEREMREVAKWDVENLPSKYAYDAQRIPVNDKLRKWLVDNIKVDADASDAKVRRLAATALDQSLLSPEDYEKLVGSKTPKVQVPYVNWWLVASYDGIVSMLWSAFRRNGVTREEVADAMTQNMQVLMEASREIERLSTPQVGNG